MSNYQSNIYQSSYQDKSNELEELRLLVEDELHNLESLMIDDCKNFVCKLRDFVGVQVEEW